VLGHYWLYNIALIKPYWGIGL